MKAHLSFFVAPTLLSHARRTIAIAFSALLFAPCVNAQVVSFTWLGTTPDASLASNWVGGLKPVGDGSVLENVVIDGSSGATLTIPATLQLNSLILNAGRPLAFVVSGSASPTLVLTGDIPVAGAGDVALASSVGIALKSDGTDNAHTIDIAQAGTTVSILANVGELATAASVTKTGSGQLQLQGTNSFTGGLTADAGIVQLVSSGARATGTWTFNNASRLNVDVTNGLSVDAETIFNNSARLNATQASAVSGGTQTFNSSSNLYASASNSVSGGTQKFYDNAYLVAEAGGAVSGGTLRFYDSASVYPNATNSITGVTLNLYENSYIIVGAVDAFSSTTNIYFNGSLGGTSGSVSLRGKNTNLGYISSGISGTGIITNDSTTAATLSLDFAGNQTFSGSIGNGSVEVGTAGALSLSKSGTGTLVLSGSNTYTGATTVNAGRLALGNNAALSSSTDVSLATAGATLDVGAQTITISTLAGVSGTSVELASGGKLATVGNGTTTFAGEFNGPTDSEFKKGGTGILSLTGTGSNVGTAIVDAGTLRIGVSQAFNSGVDITLNNSGVLAVDETQYIRRLTSGSASANVAIASGRTLKVDLPIEGETLMTSTYSGTLSGSGSLLKWGPGQLTLGGASTSFSGLVTVGSGLLEITHNGALGTTAAGTTVDTPGTLKLSNVTNLAEALTFGGSMSTASLVGTGFSSVNGNVVMNGNSIVHVPTSDDTLHLNGVISEGAPQQGLTKTGFGILKLTAANTFTGPTNIDLGLLELGHGSALQFSTLWHDNANGSLSFGSLTSATLGGLTGNQPLELDNDAEISGPVALTIGNNDANNSYSGILSGTGSLVKSGNGNMILSGANTFTGLVTVNSGTLEIQNAAALGSAVSETRVNAGATLALDGVALAAEPIKLGGGTLKASGGSSSVAGPVTLSGSGTLATFSSEDTLTISGAIGEVEGTANLTKSGIGTITLSGANTYTGSTTVTGGTLVVGNSAALGTTAGATTINPGAKLELNGAVVGAEPVTMAGGTLAASGTASLSGPVTLANVGMVDVPAGSALTLSGAIGESGGTRNLSKTGTGTLVLSGANTYTGFTTINAGTLRIGAPNTLPATTKLGFGANALLQVQENQTIKAFQGFSDATAQIIIDSGKSLTVAPDVEEGSGGIFQGSISGGGSLIIDGVNSEGFGESYVPGTFVGLAGNNSYTGGTVLNGGTLQIGNFGTTGSIAGNVTNNGLLLFSRTDGLNYNGVISGSGQVSFNGGGTFVLGASQAYTGGTFISGSTLNIGVTNALPTNAWVGMGSTGALLNVLQNQTVNSIHTDVGSTIAIASGKTFTIAPPAPNTEMWHASYISGGFSGSGTLAINSPGEQEVVLLGSSPAFTGTASLTQGILVLGNNQALGGVGTTVPIVVSGGVLAAPSGITVPNPLQLNTGSIVGSGSFGSATIGAGMDVSPVALTLVGTELDPEQTVPTVLTFTNLTLAGGGTFEVSLNQEEVEVFTLGGVGADRINVSNTLTFASTLSATPFEFKLESSSSLPLIANQSWTIISAPNWVFEGGGGFQLSHFHVDPTNIGLAFGGTFSLSQNGTNLMLNFTAVPEPSTWALLLGGIAVAGMLALRRRRTKRGMGVSPMD